MEQGCPNKSCKVSYQILFQVKDGFYHRRDDSRKIQRYKCKICQTRYSRATHTLEFAQKKRRLNRMIRANLASGMSMRSCAYNLNLARKTIERKFVYLAKKSRMNQKALLESWRYNPIKDVQFDDLISSIHTKLKPVSVSVVIDPRTFKILGARVAEIPAFGKIAALSRRKYGRRQNQHPQVLSELLFDLKGSISSDALFKTDEHKRYPEIIAKHFPRAQHKAYKGLHASIIGMGELKTKNYDPLFAINHTLACFRGGMNRFIRKTWCTSKTLKHTQDHIDIYIDYYNEKKEMMNKKK
jgi:transposase-like protein